MIQWERLLNKAKAGKLTEVETVLMVNGFDQAQLYRYEQARELSVKLLEDWLVNYKFRNWTVTATRGIKVTTQMKQKRARDIGNKLNDTQTWHSHTQGISMDVVRRDLNLQIDDFGSDQQTSDLIRNYHSLLDDYMKRMGDLGVVHAAHEGANGAYVPFMRIRE